MLRARLALALCGFALFVACEEETIARVEPRLLVEPMKLDLGDVVVGTVGRTSLHLRNDGQAFLKIISVAPDDALGGEVTITEVPEELRPGGEVDVMVAFAPSSVGDRAGQIVFTTDSRVTEVVVVEVTGRGVEPALVANPPLVDFGRVVVGKSRTATVTLTNQSAETVTVIRTSLDTGTSPEFTGELTRQDIAAGASITLPLRYTPTDLGLDEGRIIIIDSSVRPMSLAIRVRGTGVESDIEVEPRRLAFSGLHVGQTQTLPFYVRNIGERDHQVTELVVESGGAIFTLTATATPFVVAPGTGVQVDVTYQPAVAGNQTDRVRVASSGLAAPVFVDLDGAAGEAPIAAIDVSPAALAFGQVELMTTRALGVRVTNVGTADLRIDDVSLTGGPYTLSSTIGAGQIFRPGDSQQVQVTFAPLMTGMAPSELVIRSSDPMRPEVRVLLTGEGINLAVPIINVTPNPVAFGMVPRGTNASRSLTVRNDGSAPLILNQVRLSNDAGGRFLLPTPPAAGTQLAPAQSIMLAVGYLDNGVVASYTGQLQILSNDPATPTTNVALTASTEPPPVQLTDISITMTWTSRPSDVDLHLIRPGSSLFNVPGDVCYCNTNPDWGMPNVPTDNPFLDRDDLVGPGPETINLTTAESGDYTVVAHYFNDAGGGAAPIEVQVNLRGTRVATVNRSLTNNQRWTVGTITWNAATRTGTWRASALPPFTALITFCL